MVIEIAPVVVLPAPSVSVKPAEAVAVTLAIGPLSAGAAFGVTVTLPPGNRV